MTVRVALRHRTRYVYDRLIHVGPQVVRLRPAPHARSKVTSFSINVAPAQHFQNWQQDPHGNWLLRLVFPEKTRELAFDVELVAELEAQNPFDFFLEPEADFLPFEYDAESAKGLAPYLEKTAGGPLLDELVRGLRPHGKRTVDFLVEVNRTVQERTRWDPLESTCRHASLSIL